MSDSDSRGEGDDARVIAGFEGFGIDPYRSVVLILYCYQVNGQHLVQSSCISPEILTCNCNKFIRDDPKCSGDADNSHKDTDDYEGVRSFSRIIFSY